MEDIEPLVKPIRQDTVYKRRWWLLLAFAISGFTQNVVWNTWGPIAQSAKEVFGWSDGQIGMFPNLGNIAFIFTVFLASYFLDEKGLRISVVICDALILLAAGLRCITSIPKYASWLMYLSAVLNGIAGTALFAGPSLLASIWFPPNQRATATAISTFMGYAGFAVTFSIGPQLVSAPKYKTVVTRSISGNSFNFADGTTTTAANISHNHTVLLNFEQLKDDIMRLMYYECGLAAVVFIAVLIYFPNKPPSAPSYTASVKRVNYLNAICKLLSNGPLWLISLACAIPTGVFGAWGAVLDLILNPVGISQMEAGWVGFYATIAGCISCVFVARFSDIFMKHMKSFLMCLFLCGGCAIVWFTLICTKVLTFSTVQLYSSSILAGMFVNGGIALFYELCAETSYPVAEGVTGAFLTILNNVSGTVLLFVLQIPGIGTSWVNWAAVGSLGVGLFCLIIFPERYGRTDLDIAIRNYTDIVIDVPDCSVDNPTINQANIGHSE